MKTFKNLLIWVTVAVTVLSLFSASFLCFSASEKGSISVELKLEQQDAEDGFRVFASQIAAYENGAYKAVEGFEKFDVSISEIIKKPNEKTAKLAEKFVTENDIPSLESISKKGSAGFSDVDCGIWLVFCEKQAKYIFNPYFVFLPFLNEGQVGFDAKTAPKISKNFKESFNIYVTKKWDDNNNKAKKRPDYVTIELLMDGKTIDTAMLTKGNGWHHTFTQAKAGEYTVKEKAVKDYTARYEGNAKEGFEITNVYNYGKLPQTGQLWWPIAILLMAGIGFVVLGIIEIGVKKNAKKTK